MIHRNELLGYARATHITFITKADLVFFVIIVFHQIIPKLLEVFNVLPENNTPYSDEGFVG
jgi:hypothetical protein